MHNMGTKPGVHISCVQERNKKCQVLRLDLDAQTREAVFFADKYQKLAAKGEESDSSEGIKYKMHNAEDKRSRE
jgi:hypothetical protein